MTTRDTWAPLYEAARQYAYGAMTETDFRRAAVAAVYAATAMYVKKAEPRDEQKGATGT